MNQPSITVFSGYRLRFVEPQHQPAAQEIILRQLEPYVPVIALINEPYLLDDAIRGLPAEQLLVMGLAGGEFIVCMDGDKLVAFVWLQQIIHQRSAYIEAWATPDYRNDYRGRKIIADCAHQVIDYAFRPLGPVSTGGLGLIKLKARTAVPNRAAIRAMASLGFKQTGYSPVDGLYYSTPTDILELELLNPRIFGKAETQVANALQQTTDAPGIPATGAVPESRPVSEPRAIHPGPSTQSSDDSAASLKSDADSKPRKPSRRTATKRANPTVDAVGQQPDGPGGQSPSGTELVPAKRRTATRATASK